MSLTQSEFIAANRMGKLTPEQFIQLRAKADFFKVIVSPLVIVCGLLVIPILVVPASSRWVAVVIWALASICSISVIIGYKRAGDVLRLDLEPDQLQSVEGEIAVQGEIWITHPQNIRFRLIDEFQELPPGVYRFYYLPRSKWLLSADNLTPVASVNTMEHSELARLGLNHLDCLTFNRQGVLCQMQARALQRQAFKIVAQFVILAIAFASVGAVLPKAPLVLRASLTLLFTMGIAWPQLQLLWKLLLDIQGNTVRRVEGQPTKMFLGRRADRWYYEIGGLRFALPELKLDVFREEKAYCLYYTPHTQKIVGVEFTQGAG